MFSITDCVASLSLNGLNLEVLQVIKIRLPKSYAFVVKLASTLEIGVLILASSIIVSGSSSLIRLQRCYFKWYLRLNNCFS
jgi:hypothetical protein